VILINVVTFVSDQGAHQVEAEAIHPTPVTQ
jgi:hypothetical protein